MGRLAQWGAPYFFSCPLLLPFYLLYFLLGLIVEINLKFWGTYHLHSKLGKFANSTKIETNLKNNITPFIWRLTFNIQSLMYFVYDKNVLPQQNSLKYHSLIVSPLPNLKYTYDPHRIETKSRTRGDWYWYKLMDLPLPLIKLPKKWKEKSCWTYWSKNKLHMKFWKPPHFPLPLIPLWCM